MNPLHNPTVRFPDAGRAGQAEGQVAPEEGSFFCWEACLVVDAPRRNNGCVLDKERPCFASRPPLSRFLGRPLFLPAMAEPLATFLISSHSALPCTYVYHLPSRALVVVLVQVQTLFAMLVERGVIELA